jgi:GT2 family glycosyltransferase
MQPPIVSVIIPHLNQNEALVRCLESLRAQTFLQNDIEFIVVDNGSRNPPEAEVAAFPGARLLIEPEPGPGPARNLGAAHAGGRILAFIDADCRADKGWLAAAVSALDGENSTGYVGGDVKIGLVSAPLMTPLEAYESVFAYRQQLYVERDGYSGTGNMAVRRDLFVRIGGFAGIGIAEDMDWGKRAAAAGHRVRYCADMVVYHPARTSITELEAKWRRHVAHSLAQHRAGRRSSLAWIAHASAVLISTLPHVAKITVSPRLKGVRNRLSAAVVLARVRRFRALEMLRQSRDSGSAADTWNR